MSTAYPGIIILAVEELARARAFYTTAFGWPIAVETPVYVEFRCTADLRLGLYQREGFARNVAAAPTRIPAGGLAPFELYLFSDDLSTSVARLLAAGARLLSPVAPRNWGDLVGYFADPDGNILALAQLREARP